MAYTKSGTKKLRRSIAFKNWRRHISGKEKWQAEIMKLENILLELVPTELFI